jgi:hypothetical protein
MIFIDETLLGSRIESAEMWRDYADALAPIPEQGGDYPKAGNEVKLSISFNSSPEVRQKPHPPATKARRMGPS